jgi:transposase
MIRVHLPAADLARPEAAFRTTADARLRHRLQIVLMVRRGRPHGDIATDLGCSRRSAQRWLNASRDRGLDGLMPRKAAGAKPKLTPDLALVLRRWVIDGPAKHGLDRANWTYAELADHLYRTRGVRVGKSALQAFGVKQGLRPYRPTYRFLRGDAAEQAKARAETADPKKGRKPAIACC